VSTGEQATAGVSLDAQAARIKAWAEANGVEAVEIFQDKGISGTVPPRKRPGLTAALTAVGKGDALVVYSLSRLSRSTKDTIELGELLLRKEADLVSLTEKIDTTSAGGMMVFKMLAVLGEYERDLTSERTKTALAYKKMRGEKTGGPCPIGYRTDDGTHLVEDEGEQLAVKISRRMAGRGASLRKIANALEAKGIERRGMAKWHPMTVARLVARTA